MRPRLSSACWAASRLRPGDRVDARGDLAGAGGDALELAAARAPRCGRRSRCARRPRRPGAATRSVMRPMSVTISLGGARGLGGLLGQLADLVGDDREAAAALAGAGGLDRGVQRQQVRLLGDRRDRAHEAGDLLRAAHQSASLASVIAAADSSTALIAARASSAVTMPRSASASAAPAASAAASAACRARSTAAAASPAACAGLHHEPGLLLGRGGDAVRPRRRSPRWSARSRPRRRRPRARCG